MAKSNKPTWALCGIMFDSGGVSGFRSSMVSLSLGEGFSAKEDDSIEDVTKVGVSLPPILGEYVTDILKRFLNLEKCYIWKAKSLYVLFS